ncbi:amine oxidase [copper-containing] alpha 2, peroxisomal-like [Malania oleifera]|uniref:amine oxidase [copper-containing] alpha 2, peroxisomal-like n=1 Tax=Malania oleifera TaxID=397392 RepID=UPI0025AE615B|nr:amine oxidase [copper-containing] alpha 2, peroxisomal-like [Malania oleifera]
MAWKLRDLSLLLLVSVFFLPSPISSQKHHPLRRRHPLDSLSESELSHVQILIKSKYPTSSHNLTFHYVGVDEPDKATILSSWLSKPGATDLPPPRRALVHVRVNCRSRELVVELRPTRSIVSDKVHDGDGYPILTLEEQAAAGQETVNYPPFMASIRKRGLDISQVVCSTSSVGWFGEKKSRRVIRVVCFYRNGTVNVYMRPIEGITVVFDLDEMKITKYKDWDTVPLPKAGGTEYQAAKQAPPFGPHPGGVTVVQSDGPGFRVDDGTVRWANWKFHLSFDVRVGPIISLASIYDVNCRVSTGDVQGPVSIVWAVHVHTEECTSGHFSIWEIGLGYAAIEMEPLDDCPRQCVAPNPKLSLPLCNSTRDDSKGGNYVSNKHWESLHELPRRQRFSHMPHAPTKTLTDGDTRLTRPHASSSPDLRPGSSTRKPDPYPSFDLHPTRSQQRTRGTRRERHVA